MSSHEFLTSRVPWLLMLGVVLQCSCRSQPSPQSEDSVVPQWNERPNIVWLVAEDLGPYLPAFGDSTIGTPHLSRLASEGVRYTNVFSPSGVCAPSRAALATGMYPTTIGAMHMRTGPWWSGRPSEDVIDAARRQMPDGVGPYEAVPPPEARMHSEYLRRAGYYTSNNNKEDYQFVAPVTAWDDSSPRAHWRNRRPGQPFFAVFNFNVTHESRIWSKSTDSLLVPDTLQVPVPPYLPHTKEVRDDVRRMYSNIIEMDSEVGEAVAELGASGLLDSTIVFWFADNGGPLPRQKRTLYDAGIRVPLIIRFPNGWRAGTVDDRLISFVDFLPTLMSIAGMQPPEHVHGQAFEGPYRAPEDRQYVHAAADRLDEHYDAIRAVRDVRYKYLVNLRPDQGYYLPLAYREQMSTMSELLSLQRQGRLDSVQGLWFREAKPREELFDTQRDPHELRNLANDPEHADVLAEFRSEYRRWSQAYRDLGLVPEPEYVRSIWPGGSQPATLPPAGEWLGDRLKLVSGTPGASIGYQLLSQSETRTVVWQVYVGPISVRPHQTVVAVAHRIGYRQSPERAFRRSGASG